jgi:ketosteroid isomerase-like protein
MIHGAVVAVAKIFGEHYSEPMRASIGELTLEGGQGGRPRPMGQVRRRLAVQHWLLHHGLGRLAMSELDDFRSETLARQVKAEEALVRGDPMPRMKMWSMHDPVTLFSAGGECKSGWEEISGFFRWLASRFSKASGFRFDIEAVEISGELAYAVGFERFNASIAGGPVEPITIRVTHVYRRENGEWKIVHRHGDAAPSDQSRSMEATTE